MTTPVFLSQSRLQQIDRLVRGDLGFVLERYSQRCNERGKTEIVTAATFYQCCGVSQMVAGFITLSWSAVSQRNQQRGLRASKRETTFGGQRLKRTRCSAGGGEPERRTRCRSPGCGR